MTNQQGAQEAPSYEHQRAIMEGERNASLDAYSRVVYLTQTESRIYEAAFTNGWNRLAALANAQQPAAHIQNPAEIEHVAGDVSKNGAEVNTSTKQPAAQQGAADGFFLLLPQRPKPEAPAGTAGLDWDAYSGAQMLAFGRDCSDAAIAALRTQQPAPAGATPDATWCAYVAGMICTYLKEDADGAKAKAIAGIIERRLMFLAATPQPAPATQQAGERVYAFRRKGLADFCTCDEARYEELSNKPHLFETRIFYTAPQPSPTAQAADSVPAPVEELDDDACRCEPSDYVRPADYDGDGSVAAMARRAARTPADSVTAPAAGAVAGPVEADTVDMVGVRANGEHVNLGKIAMPPRMKAREIAQSQFGSFNDEDGSDAELCFGAMEELLAWLTKQGLESATTTQNQRGLIQQMLEALESSRVLKADHESLESYGVASMKHVAAMTAARTYIDTGSAPAAAPFDQHGGHLVTRESAIQAIEHVALSNSMGLEAIDMLVAAAPTPPAQAADSVLEDAAFDAVRKKLCALPRYSFVLDDDGLIRRVQDRSGSWIEFDDAHELFDPVAVDAARKQGGKP